jgi:hypothetical protein
MCGLPLRLHACPCIRADSDAQPGAQPACMAVCTHCEHALYVPALRVCTLRVDELCACVDNAPPSTLAPCDCCAATWRTQAWVCLWPGSASCAGWAQHA